MALAQTRSRLLQIQLFGEPRFFADGALQAISIPPKAILLLCVLALKAGQPVDRAKLAYTLWPDDPEDEAKGKLRRHLHLLIRGLALPEDQPCIVANSSTLTWTTQESCSVDVVEFERTSAAPEELERAVILYTGDLLANFYEEWLEPPRRRLRESQLQNLLALAERYGESDAARALGYARAALRVDPWREDALRHVLLARTQLGDRAGAMQEYTDFAKRLREEFDAEPLPETKNAFEATKIAEPALTNLPLETTSFIGREAQLRALCNLLDDCRMVTLTGPGGVGKSRTALHCARERIGSYRDGVWLIEVSAQTSESSLVHAIAATLGLRDLPQSDAHALAAALSQRQALLLLDNCETLVDVCGRVCEAILASCEHVRILATSREPLAIAGERTLRLAPFTDDFEAVRLFFDRARAVDATFEDTADNRIVVADICRRVDRLPLATELAAARVATLTPAEILERLHDRFALLRRTRIPAIRHHQTLRATIDWSYNLLSLEEKTLFRRMAIFPAAFTIAAIEEVCSDRSLPRASILDTLSRLVDKSLAATVLSSDARRYRFLDSIREFALTELYECGDADALRERYLEYYKSVARHGAEGLNGPRQQELLQLLQEELDNLRLAMEFGQIDGRLGATALEIACDLQQFWLIRGYFGEGRRWLQQSLDAASSGTTPSARANALSALAIFACFSDDLESAERYEREALDLRTAIGDERSIAESLHVLGGIAYDKGDIEVAHEFWSTCLEKVRAHGDSAQLAKTLDNLGLTYADLTDYESAERCLNESLAAYQAIEDSYGLAWVLGHQGRLAQRLHQYEKAVRLHSESLALRERLHDRHGIASCLHYLSDCHYSLGDVDAALEAARASIRIWHELRYKIWLADAFENLACIECARSEFGRAAVLLASAARLREVTAKPLPRYQREHHDTATACVTAALNPRQIEEKQRIGSSLSLDAIVAFALS